MEEERKIRHLVEKRQKGHSLFYWQPSAGLKRAGYTTVTLGKDRAAAIEQAEAINAKVDQWREGQLVIEKNRHGTLPWLIEQYRNDHKYKKLRRKVAFEWHLRQLLKWSGEKGDPPLRTIKRSDAKALWAQWGDQGKLGTAGHIIRTASILWNFALRELEDHDVVDKNPFAVLGMQKPPPRQVVWEPEQVAAAIEAALTTPAYVRGGARRRRPVGFRKSIADAIMIIHNTTLREGDVLALMESNYDGTKITCTPSKTRDKTGVTVKIPATPELKAWLDDMLAKRRDSTVVSLHQQDRPLVINEATGARYTDGRFQSRFREVCNNAGLPTDLWFEDLRRTATVQLAEAGLTEAQIAAFGGWSATSVAAMMKIYRPTNVKMAEEGMARLIAYRAKDPSAG